MTIIDRHLQRAPAFYVARSPGDAPPFATLTVTAGRAVAVFHATGTALRREQLQELSAWMEAVEAELRRGPRGESLLHAERVAVRPAPPGAEPGAPAFEVAPAPTDALPATTRPPRASNPAPSAPAPSAPTRRSRPNRRSR